MAGPVRDFATSVEYEEPHIYLDEYERRQFELAPRENEDEDILVISDDEDDEEGDKYDEEDAPLATLQQEDFPEQVEIPNSQLRLYNGEYITVAPGDTVELKDTQERDTPGPHSGDFLRIMQIFENLNSGEVKLRGYRLRRTKYIHPQFGTATKQKDGSVKIMSKLNEVYIVIHAITKANDPRPPMVQGLVDINPDEVLRGRRCIFTHLPWDSYAWNRMPFDFPDGIATEEAAKEHAFHNTVLTCRWVNIQIRQKIRALEGEARALYERESDPLSTFADLLKPTIPDSSKISSDPKPGPSMSSRGAGKRPRSSSMSTRGASKRARRERSPSLEEIDELEFRPTAMNKSSEYSFGDCFCGIGGTSKGAEDAGLKVVFGVDLDQPAMNTYRANFKDVAAYEFDMHQLPEQLSRSNSQVDILHLSCPCQYWSVAHVRPGKHDEMNIGALQTVGPSIRALKPRIVSLEQAFGLILQEKHLYYWRHLIHQMVSSGYKVRYKVIDFVQYGLCQRRKRLIIYATKPGTPLPAFPLATHGTKGSELNHFVTAHKALKSLKFLAKDDPWHKPEEMAKVKKPEKWDPKRSVCKHTITCDGGLNKHFDGVRKYTPRELAAYQSFPPNFEFLPDPTKKIPVPRKTKDNQDPPPRANPNNGMVIKQVGNAYPPLAAEKILLACAQTMEARDHGLLAADEEIFDLHELLTGKGVNLSPHPRARNAFASSSRSKSKETDFRYLPRLEKTMKELIEHHPFTQNKSLRFGTPSDSEPPSPRASNFDGAGDQQPIPDCPQPAQAPVIDLTPARPATRSHRGVQQMTPDRPEPVREPAQAPAPNVPAVRPATRSRRGVQQQTPDRPEPAAEPAPELARSPLLDVPVVRPVTRSRCGVQQPTLDHAEPVPEPVRAPSPDRPAPAPESAQAPSPDVPAVGPATRPRRRVHFAPTPSSPSSVAAVISDTPAPVQRPVTPPLGSFKRPLEILDYDAVTPPAPKKAKKGLQLKCEGKYIVISDSEDEDEKVVVGLDWRI